MSEEKDEEVVFTIHTETENNDLTVENNENSLKNKGNLSIFVYFIFILLLFSFSAILIKNSFNDLSNFVKTETIKKKEEKKQAELNKLKLSDEQKIPEPIKTTKEIIGPVKLVKDLEKVPSTNSVDSNLILKEKEVNNLSLLNSKAVPESVNLQNNLKFCKPEKINYPFTWLPVFVKPKIILTGMPDMDEISQTTEDPEGVEEILDYEISPASNDVEEIQKIKKLKVKPVKPVKKVQKTYKKPLLVYKIKVAKKVKTRSRVIALKSKCQSGCVYVNGENSKIQAFFDDFW